MESDVSVESDTEPEEMDVDLDESMMSKSVTESSITLRSSLQDENQVDSSLADWFQISPKDADPEEVEQDDGSETEPESDNVDVQDLDVDIDDSDDDDWYKFPTAEVVQQKSNFGFMLIIMAGDR
jgi:hypothetical protein